MDDARRRTGCPKRMVFGPCGGVRDDGRCEVAEHRCVFLDDPAPHWDAPAPAPAPPRPGSLLDRARTRPVVLTDLTVAPYDPASLRRVVAVLAPVSNGLLVGEHANRPDLPPTLFAAEVLDAGGRPWTTLACRDRNRVVLEQELAGLAAVGVDGVLCVTGDARGPGVRPGVTQVFDLDGTRLAALAAAAGLTVAVPESPDAPPAPRRPARVADKQRAGAQVCVLNHVRTPAGVAAFVAAARRAGATLPFVAAVAVYTDERSARVLQRFPGLHVDDAAVERVLAAPDPREAGIAAAVAEARALLAVPGVVGVNLSGLASDGGEDAGARVKAEVAAAIGEGT
ncbi:Methylene-tetrahydrofolate reductase C terminal [Geodermatophilus dictyosporus]|uniref:Methylene-tetrahydrofolate reductase C terminal n=1 Tax=Geodermatophilus dictyosporus TaxID=1523247 RepID=A0A1I5N1D9_9ACTN|nr:methylenetetrahydrofolate reductase C-terminal domain-containing protein [Geodermatophilus dictyosporus]SFP15589.1 Methylene-tetrahydrofolate reductase C terminal [Geodermatophilus dictyosporus]